MKTELNHNNGFGTWFRIHTILTKATAGRSVSCLTKPLDSDKIYQFDDVRSKNRKI
jgi:hypothetical protein